jgi:hypothetical protein
MWAEELASPAVPIAKRNCLLRLANALKFAKDLK